MHKEMTVQNVAEDIRSIISLNPGLIKRSVDIADFEDEALSNIYDPDAKNEVIWI